MIKIQLMEKLNYFNIRSICLKYRFIFGYGISDEAIYSPFRVKFGGIFHDMMDSSD